MNATICLEIGYNLWTHSIKVHFNISLIKRNHCFIFDIMDHCASRGRVVLQTCNKLIMF